MHANRFISRLVGMLLAVTAPAVAALDAREMVRQAVDLIGNEQYSLARAYLDPALIAPSLSSGERSRAYYLRGFSFVVQKMPVSARKDYNRALEFNPQNPAALVELGRLHQVGFGTAADPQLAARLFQRAAEMDYPPAQFHLGQAYLVGLGVDEDLGAAREWLGEAASAGHAFAMMNLAASYRADSVDDPQPDIARAWYDKAHAAGEPRALLSLAYMFRNGEFGEADPAKAVTYFQQALDAGVEEAAVGLAYAYLVGEGVDEIPARAFALYERAAKAGVKGSYVGLGHLYEYGIGTGRDRAAAIQWYEKAATHGSLDAQRRLVGVYLRSTDAPARDRALYWSKRAADSGSPQAQNDYAWLLATSKHDDLRNGTLALDQAAKAVEAEPSAAFLDTLAAAYAELGEFEQAVAVQERALQAIAVSEGDIREELELRLAYYRRSEPWRE